MTTVKPEIWFREAKAEVRCQPRLGFVVFGEVEFGQEQADGRRWFNINYLKEIWKQYRNAFVHDTCYLKGGF